MSTDKGFNKNNLDEYLKELGKEYRKLNGKSVPAEIILVGGAAVLANYGFRELTYDVDAIIYSSSVMKQAANNVGDRLNLSNDWLNADFIQTDSYSNKLSSVSKYYRQFSNILTVRTVSEEYLLAMKLMSGRAYKHDLSDITGILLEHQKLNKPIAREKIEQAITKLYGDDVTLPNTSFKLLNDVYSNIDLEELYKECLKNEENSKQLLTKFSQDYPTVLTAKNIGSILDTLNDKEQQVATKPVDDITAAVNKVMNEPSAYEDIISKIGAEPVEPITECENEKSETIGTTHVNISDKRPAIEPVTTPDNNTTKNLNNTVKNRLF